jgi:nitric oxide reductase NorQ protein
VPLTDSLAQAPWYLPLADEVQLFEATYRSRLPVLLKGPTGCGKTRCVEHMAWRLKRLSAAYVQRTPLPGDR